MKDSDLAEASIHYVHSVH